MRTRSIVLVALLASVTTAMAIGQTTAASVKTPAGLSLAYDAAHNHLSASGYTINVVPSASAVTTTVSGILNVTITLNEKSKFATGTVVKCAVLALGGLVETTTTTTALEGGIEEASTHAATAAGKTTCKLSIPYSWNMVDLALSISSDKPGAAATTAESMLLVGFAVAAYAPDGDITRATMQIGDMSALPANGATTTLKLNAEI